MECSLPGSNADQNVLSIVSQINFIIAAPVINFKGAREGAIPPKQVEDPEAERAVTDERGRDKGSDKGSAKGNVERGRCSGRVFVIEERDDGAVERVSYN